MKLDTAIFVFKVVRATSELAYLLGYKIGLRIHRK
jgi:hypothetical protein